MPFNFTEYQRKVACMDNNELRKSKEHYNRDAYRGGAGCVASAILLVPTLGISSIGWASSTAMTMNASVKVHIINEEMRSRAAYAPTRKRDVAVGITTSAIATGAGCGIAHGVGDLMVGSAFAFSHPHGVEPLRHLTGFAYDRHVDRVCEQGAKKLIR
ncbi:hypothetical protein LTR99_001182 [Exophiala xenobiotica]|uniref:Uncharacterized protein n=1 Tax=Vermiconidia calcicola TaxID=1690605 RepID=A0AAV9QKS6_9PEZI|nr:hypothetical protein LTR92_001615 [Exophiala xenobiotica]KAK5545743.1 hypothetical protein LTR25_000752 [Vermiconidia calcicola]KAK5549996.1 hypothetical protein LTR23_000288 [Chaetothyriales sp. CCFEE 6169]KAK5229874.1 hypothetical protein LTR72_001407 [Exophiala xenobiotica]KAK5271661.1 hypothetical protein LTR96_003487 [Exophiala xenobiotica]